MLAFSGPVFRIFAPPSPVSPAHSPLAARGYGPAYFRASPSKWPGPSRHLASLTAARCSGAADALWAWPQFGMVVPHRSQARLRRSLPHWAYYALFRPQGARFVRPSRLQPLRGLRLRTSCARHFSPSGLRCSQAHSRLSLPYWAYFALLRALRALRAPLSRLAPTAPLCERGAFWKVLYHRK